MNGNSIYNVIYFYFDVVILLKEKIQLNPERDESQLTLAHPTVDYRTLDTL